MGFRPAKGGDAEDRAAHWCRQRGWRLIERNYRARAGELDLVCLDGATLVFVEVRQRRSQRYGGALASITRSKQHKLIRAAQLYQQTHPELASHASRFDVIALGADNQIDWIKGAFNA